MNSLQPRRVKVWSLVGSWKTNWVGISDLGYFQLSWKSTNSNGYNLHFHHPLQDCERCPESKPRWEIMRWANQSQVYPHFIYLYRPRNLHQRALLNLQQERLLSNFCKSLRHLLMNNSNRWANVWTQSTTKWDHSSQSSMSSRIWVAQPIELKSDLLLYFFHFLDVDFCKWW